MDGDLNLSQALGGLRIANPDDASSPASIFDSQTSSRDLPSSPSPLQTVNIEARNANGHLPLVGSSGSFPERPLSQLDFDPASYSLDSVVMEPSMATQSARPEVTMAAAGQLPSPTNEHQLFHRKSTRQSTGLPSNHHGQQQPQFPHHPNAIAQQQRAINSSARPSSTAYTSQPSNSGPPAREGSYRLHKEQSQSSLSEKPRRNASRAAAVLQAGVPSREDSHTDRAYRSAQKVSLADGSLPPRRSSRGVTATSAGPLNSSPYNTEGGPPASSEEWQERGAAMGIRQEIDANGKPVQRYVKKGVKDFHFGRTLGEGSYSTVMLATDRQTGKEYAIKILDKRHIIKEKKVKYVNIERDTLNRLTDHPGVVRLYYTFQDERSLYFVLDVASGGELLGVLKRMTTFDEECTRFYCAEILDTINYMHSRGVIHRDLKPENVLMDDKMHIKITDFGTAKILDPPKRKVSSGLPLPGDQIDDAEENKAVSFVGTAEYVSPELLTEKNAGKASDLWAFGCILYQLLAGRPPFKAANEYLTFQKIVALEYSFPTGFPPVARDLVERLLVLDPAQRLTMDHIKNHEFFDGIAWGRGLWQLPAPRLKSLVLPAPSTIRLNGEGVGNGNVQSAYPPDITPSHSTKPALVSGGANGNGGNGQSRPSTRVITELPPPSQLDIEWSPVLTRVNERILKLGNQLVLCTTTSSSPHGSDGNKLSRFFGGGGNAKKRQRLVMVTSSGRIIITAADEKKTKYETSLLEEGCIWKKMQDSKGLSYWVVDTREKHFTFEDVRSPASEGAATSIAADDWLEAVKRAREIALSQSMTNSYSGDEEFSRIGLSTSSKALEMSSDRHTESPSASSSRHTLQKFPSVTNPDELKGFKRFSKRQSKSGLAAVF